MQPIQTQNQSRKQKQINQNTIAYFEPIWLSNAQANRFVVDKHRKLSSLVPCRQKVAFVCGAGPSLGYHLDVIKHYRSKIEIWCVETAYPILRQNDIRPEYVINMDATDISKPLSMFGEHGGTSLIVSTVTHPSIISAWKNRMYFYNLFDPNVAPLLTIAKTYPKLPCVASKFNVGELCMQFACCIMEYPVVAMTGMDYGFVNDDIYAKGHGHNIAPEEKLGIICLFSNLSKPIYTTVQYYEFCKAFMINYEQYRKNCSILNLSMGIIPLRYDKAKVINILKAL